MNNSGIFDMCKEAVTNNVSVRPSTSKEKEKEKERREQKGRRTRREKSVDDLYIFIPFDSFIHSFIGHSTIDSVQLF